MAFGAATWAQAAPPAAVDLPVSCVTTFKPKARLDGPAACEAARRVLAAALKRPVRLVGLGKAGSSDHLVLSLETPRPHAVRIAARGKLRGRGAAYGPITMDVMDRPLRQADVERLIGTMAESLSGR